MSKHHKQRSCKIFRSWVNFWLIIQYCVVNLIYCHKFKFFLGTQSTKCRTIVFFLTELAPPGWFSQRVDMSICRCVCVCHYMHFLAFHWPWDHMISSRPLIGPPSLPPSLGNLGTSELRNMVTWKMGNWETPKLGNPPPKKQIWRRRKKKPANLGKPSG